MSILNSIIASSASATATGQQVVARTNTQQQAQNAVQTAVQTGAVVVQLSANATSSSERGTSYGENRQVDGSFNAKEKALEKKKEDEGKKTGPTVNVSA